MESSPVSAPFYACMANDKCPISLPHNYFEHFADVVRAMSASESSLSVHKCNGSIAFAYCCALINSGIIPGKPRRILTYFKLVQGSIQRPVVFSRSGFLTINEKEQKYSAYYSRTRAPCTKRNYTPTRFTS